jgi:hypothetical protein
MTHAAAATRTLRSPRRRPDGPAVREHAGAVPGAVVAGVASFVDHDWLAPGGPVAAGAWFLVALWVVTLARTIVRGDDVIFSEEDS